MTSGNVTEVTEGQATIFVSSDQSEDVFYNPVQEFNRDMSIAVINQFAEDSSNMDEKIRFGDGLSILEALSATGLRSIRYAKEIPRSKRIVANDFSKRAVASIDNNIEKNGVGGKVVSSHADASVLMASVRKQTDKNVADQRFSVVDLDPYGSPTPFLDGAVQCVAEGGLLCVTCTDMAVLCGNAAETCYTKYGAVSLRGKNVHEMALRIVLQAIESHANRYGRYIVPLVSLSIDFYCRVFVRVYTSQKVCKRTTSKLGYLYQCTGCESLTVQPLGVVKVDEKNNVKYGLPTAPAVSPKCKFCNSCHHMGGPYWTAPIHDMQFVRRLCDSLEGHEGYGTIDRMRGMLAVVAEELPDVPFYYVHDRLCSIAKVRVGKMTEFRSAFLNAGFRVSLSHANVRAVKTDAPNEFVWDVVRAWRKANEDLRTTSSNLDNNPVAKALTDESRGSFTDIGVDFTEHADANPPSRKSEMKRFQINPPNWGPKCRAKVGQAAGDDVEKRAKNQGKYTKKRREEMSSGEDGRDSKQTKLAS